MALVPNDEQKKLITKYGYDYRKFLIEYEDDNCIVIISKASKETYTLKK